MPGLTSQQKRQLLKLMQSGFENYAWAFGARMRVDALTDSPEQNRALIERYGKEFCDILDRRPDWRESLPEFQEDLPDLQEDLFNLIERGCSPLEIIDLMFACTRPWSFAISDSLASVGLNDLTLYTLALACHWVAGKISVLNMPQIPGPLFFLSHSFPKLSEEDQERFRQDIQQLPRLLRLFGDLVRIYLPDKTLIAELEPVLIDCELLFFYRLLCKFNFGYPTLSYLLKTMRQVRNTLAPKAQDLRWFLPVRITPKRSGSPVPVMRDPLSESALQQRLYRFSKTDGLWHSFSGSALQPPPCKSSKTDEFWSCVIQRMTLRHLSDEFLKQRAHAATLLSLHRELMMPMPWPASHPSN